MISKKLTDPRPSGTPFSIGDATLSVRIWATDPKRAGSRGHMLEAASSMNLRIEIDENKSHIITIKGEESNRSRKREYDFKIDIGSVLLNQIVSFAEENGILSSSRNKRIQEATRLIARARKLLSSQK
ncbi:MAG: hypothetical protein AB7O88_21985 [Reyranellaceae bacterium]